MKKILLFRFLTFFIVFSETLFAQDYFSKRSDFNGNSGSDYSQDIIEEIDGFTLLFESQNPYLIYRLIAFQNIDLSGNTIGTPVIYYDSNCNIQTGYPGSFIKLSGTDHYACLATKMQWVPEGRYDRGWLMILDDDLDTLWTKTYTDDPPHDTSTMFWNFRQLVDGGYIVVGLLNPVSGTGLFRIGMFRLDSIGGLIWKQKYGTGNADIQPFDVSPTSDCGFIISGMNSLVNGPGTQNDDPIIIKTDSIGNQDWILNLGNPNCHESYAMVDQAKDGNIQVGTIYSDTCWSDNVWKGRINFLKIRNDKSIVWDKKYGLQKIWINTLKVRVLPNSDVIGTGWYWDYSGGTGPRVVSWILRTDSAGNEKWYREYILLTGNKSHNMLWNVIPTSDNGFAACGNVVPVAPDTGTQDSWVLKVDSLGCEAPGDCWVGQNEIIVKTFTPDKPYVVFPNPALNKTTIEFHENPSGAQVVICNILGKTCYSGSIQPLQDRLEIDVGSWRKGIYIVRVMAGEKIIGTDKLIIQ